MTNSSNSATFTFEGAILCIGLDRFVLSLQNEETAISSGSNR